MTTILGLDLGKFKSVSCLYRPATQETAYATIDTDSTLLCRHLEQLRRNLVVFETCTIAGSFVVDRPGTIGVSRRAGT
jgi:hypothetical protein